MTLVDISRLRAQINALMLQYENCSRFIQFLVALLEDYRDKTKPHFFERVSILPTFKIPLLVKSELDLAFSELAQQQGDAVLPLADGLWDFNSFETKLFSIILLANLKSSDHHQLVNRLAQWIQPQTDQVLVNEILNQCVYNFEILEADAFFNLIARWLSSTDMEMKKAGLKSISLVIAIKDYSNLPKIFQLLNPVIDQPIVQIQSDLLSLIRLLTSHSQAETASFLFSKYKLSNNSDVKKFIRKCIPYLDKFFVDEFGTFVQ